MAAGLVVPISGPYTATWNALPMGVQYDDGYQLACTIQGQEVNLTDQYGMTLVEAIYRGQNWRATIRGVEWNKTGLLSSLQMFGQTGAAGTFNPSLANIGNRWTLFCQPLILTAILGNPPCFPATLTATNAGIAPQSQSQMNFTSKVREMPLEFVLIPYASVVGSVTSNVPFTTT